MCYYCRPVCAYTYRHRNLFSQSFAYKCLFHIQYMCIHIYVNKFLFFYTSFSLMAFLCLLLFLLLVSRLARFLFHFSLLPSISSSNAYESNKHNVARPHSLGALCALLLFSSIYISLDNAKKQPKHSHTRTARLVARARAERVSERASSIPLRVWSRIHFCHLTVNWCDFSVSVCATYNRTHDDWWYLLFSVNRVNCLHRLAY